MLFVLVALVLAANTVALAALRVNRLERREHVREQQAWTAERGNLLDRIGVLAGHPWTPPPRPAKADVEPDEERALARSW